MKIIMLIPKHTAAATECLQAIKHATQLAHTATTVPRPLYHNTEIGSDTTLVSPQKLRASAKYEAKVYSHHSHPYSQSQNRQVTTPITQTIWTGIPCTADTLAGRKWSDITLVSPQQLTLQRSMRQKCTVIIHTFHHKPCSTARHQTASWVMGPTAEICLALAHRPHLLPTRAFFRPMSHTACAPAGNHSWSSPA